MTDQARLAAFLRARVVKDERTVPMPDFQRSSNPRAWYSTDFDVVFLDTDRWLAECESKQRILDHYRALERLAAADGASTEVIYQAQGVFEALQDLALVYANHPDYCEEWRP